MGGKGLLLLAYGGGARRKAFGAAVAADPVVDGAAEEATSVISEMGNKSGLNIIYINYVVKY